MVKRGCLRSKDGSTFLLAPKVTTIGREGCDLVAPVVGVDYQHAVIEYSDQEDCFVLQDLNTQQGTFVNECRIQNAAVRLAPGDEIRFGNNNSSFRFEVESQIQLEEKANSQFQQQSVQERGAWTQPLTVLSNGPSPPTFLNSETLPQLQSITKATTATWANNLGGNGYQTTTGPRPPSSIKSRPMSAGGNMPQAYVGRRHSDRSQLNSSTLYSPLPQGNITHRAIQGGGWVSMGPLNTRGSQQSSPGLITVDNTALQDKDQKISRLTEEIRRLHIFESECTQKDDHILVLREEIAELQKQLRQMELSKTTSQDAEITQKLLALENEVSMKKSEILVLKEKIQKASANDSRAGSPGSTREELNNRISEVNSLRQELERVKKDKNIMSGLVTSMQKDMANKDTTVTRLSQEIETVKRELEDRNVQLVSMQSKFKKADENRKFDEELEAKEKELAIMRMKVKNSESKAEEQTAFVKELKEELNKKQQTTKDDQESLKSIQFEMESTKAKYLDMERTERLVRVDLEQSNKRFERLKNRVVQITFSTPGIKAPSGELDDDVLFETLKKLIDERSDLKSKMNDSSKSMATIAAHKKEAQKQMTKMKDQFNEAVRNLKAKGLLCGSLKDETDKLRCLSIDEDLTWVCQGMISMLSMFHDWEGQIESSLQDCGINIKISGKTPAMHILELRDKGKELKNEKTQLNATLDNMSEKYRQDLEVALKQQREELQNAVTDEVARVKSQHAEILKQRLNEAELTQEEKLESAIEAERLKVTEINTQMAKLKASIGEREESDKANKEATKLALDQIDGYKQLEEHLRDTIKRIEAEKDELQTKLDDTETRWNEKANKEIESYKEEIKQHSVTICAMTERVNKLVTRNKSYQAENNSLKQTVNELRSKPRPAPKPQVIIQKPVQDVIAMEQLITQLRREIVDYKKQQQDAQNTITALRKDVAGAAARLSDMQGELSEDQKQQMEKNRALVMQKESELLESRQQLAKLSQIIDQQGAEIKSMSIEISKQKSQLNKYKNATNEKESSMKDLQIKLEKEMNEKRKQREEIEDEGRITSEMTALGAQCRGERHEQIIARQREALMELRQRIKSLEQIRPPIPSHDQALQQVILLKKELAEMRANNAISNVNTKALTSTLEHHVNKSRGLEPSNDAQIERSAHRETLDSLETSETTFLTMLRGISAALDMDEVGGMRSMAHIPKDERRHLAQQRDHSVEVITSKIRALRERINRKDELLQGYERDLAKLRQAEKLAEHKHAQVESLSADVRLRTEESQYLRESLSKTRDKLDQEKRLNSSIKQKKTFHLENEPTHCGPFPSNRHQKCYDDIFGKQAAKKKAHNESLKRKNYEIQVLKGELSQREQDLVNAHTRLTTLETPPVPVIDDEPTEIEP